MTVRVSKVYEKIKKDGRKLRSESTADLILNTALKLLEKVILIFHLMQLQKKQK